MYRFLRYPKGTTRGDHGDAQESVVPLLLDEEPDGPHFGLRSRVRFSPGPENTVQKKE